MNVPTWDYIAIHIYGKIRILDLNESYQHLDDLMNQHEQYEEHGLKISDFEHSYIEKEMKGIVAFEIEAYEIQSAFKLSQNRNLANIQNILVELEKRGDDFSTAIAHAIRKDRNLNFH